MSDEPTLWRLESLRPRVQYGVWSAGELIHDWPLQAQTPTIGDQIELPSGVYEVIRRRWVFTEPRLHELRIGVQPVPPRGSG